MLCAYWHKMPRKRSIEEGSEAENTGPPSVDHLSSIRGPFTLRPVVENKLFQVPSKLPPLKHTRRELGG